MYSSCLFSVVLLFNCCYYSSFILCFNLGYCTKKSRGLPGLFFCAVRGYPRLYLCRASPCNAFAPRNPAAHCCAPAMPSIAPAVLINAKPPRRGSLHTVPSRFNADLIPAMPLLLSTVQGYAFASALHCRSRLCHCCSMQPNTILRFAVAMLLTSLLSLAFPCLCCASLRLS